MGRKGEDNCGGAAGCYSNDALLCAHAQAHADALGTWGGGQRSPDGQMARRAWEGDGRIDLRSVTNSLRQLPYHVAWQRGFRQAATVLNPTIAIDIALETARDLDDGALPPSIPLHASAQATCRRLGEAALGCGADQVTCILSCKAFLQLTRVQSSWAQVK